MNMTVNFSFNKKIFGTNSFAENSTGGGGGGGGGSGKGDKQPCVRQLLRFWLYKIADSPLQEHLRV